MRILPRARWQRLLVWVALAIGYAALMWYVVFPWAVHTFYSPTV